MTPRSTPLPINLPPRGLSREMAAAYIGVSPSTFDKLVGAGQMPSPKRIGGRRVWDKAALDSAFDRLPGGGEEVPIRNSWDRVLMR